MAHAGTQGNILDKALDALKKDPNDENLQANVARARAAYDASLVEHHQKVKD